MARRSATPGHIRKREGKRGTRYEYFFDAGLDPVTGKRRPATSPAPSVVRLVASPRAVIGLRDL